MQGINFFKYFRRNIRYVFKSWTFFPEGWNLGLELGNPLQRPGDKQIAIFVQIQAVIFFKFLAIKNPDPDGYSA